MTGTHIEFDLRGVASELKDRLIAVPIYQRSFAWTSEEIQEYWEDLHTAFSEAAPEYFLGTIVLTRQEEVSRDAVIDGQQRLATTSILLAAIRDEYRERGDPGRATIVQGQYLSTSDLKSASEVARLTLNSDDAYFFERRIIQGAVEPEPTRGSHKLILDAHAYFRDQIRKVADDAGSQWTDRLTQWVDFLRTRLKVIVLEVPTESDAFLIFETLNDRGADLTIADLLKNYLFGHAGGKLDSVRDGWMTVLGALEISAENSLFTTFLRHYWSSLHGAVRERDLYKSIKDHVVTELQTVAFVNDLQRASTIYSALLNSDHEYWDKFGGTTRGNLHNILTLNLEQHRPLLLAALQHFALTEQKRLLRSILSWSVRGLVVGGIGGGTAEKAYCSAAVKIRRGDIKTARDVLSEISGVVPSDEEFRAGFATARVTRSALARYYLIALERGHSGEQEPELVPNENEDQVNLEHVLPKRPSAQEWEQFAVDDRRDLVNRLGNLTLLQKGPNDRIGNKPFSTKKPILLASGFVFTREVGELEDWTKERIIERQARLAEVAIAVWPRGG